MPMRIKLRRPKELSTLSRETWSSPSPTPQERLGGGALQKPPFSALYLPILAPEFTE